MIWKDCIFKCWGLINESRAVRNSKKSLLINRIILFYVLKQNNVNKQNDTTDAFLRSALWRLAHPEGVSSYFTWQPDVGQTGHRWGVWIHRTLCGLETPTGQRLRHPGPLHHHEGRKKLFLVVFSLLLSFLCLMLLSPSPTRTCAGVLCSIYTCCWWL